MPDAEGQKLDLVEVEPGQGDRLLELPDRRPGRGPVARDRLPGGCLDLGLREGIPLAASSQRSAMLRISADALA